MACQFDRDLLQDYTEDTADALEKVIIREHLKWCPDCRKELNRQILLLWELEQVRREPVTLPSELDRIRESLVASAIRSPALETRKADAAAEEKPARRAGLRDTVRRLRQVRLGALHYLKLVPGTKLVGKAAGKTQQLLANAASSLVRSGFRRVKERVFS